MAGTAVDETPQISDLAEWVRGLDEPSVAPLLTALRQTLDSFVEIGLGWPTLLGELDANRGSADPHNLNYNDEGSPQIHHVNGLDPANV